MNVGFKIMDVDTPNILKRCSSAPLINEAASTTTTSPTTNSAPRSTSFFGMFSNNSLPRTRSNSISCSPLSAAINIPMFQGACGRRLTPRVNQLRAEECADVSNQREVAHEREVHSAMQMGQSYEDLTLVGGPANSPTRLPRFAAVVSPSPPRKYTTRRSLSPNPIRAGTLGPLTSLSPLGAPGPLGPLSPLGALSPLGPLRPRALGGKRRCDDAERALAKRMCTGRLTPTTPTTPGTPDSDSLECTFRPVSPRPQPMSDSELPPHKASPS